MKKQPIIDCMVHGYEDELLGESMIAEVITDGTENLSKDFLIECCRIKLGLSRNPTVFKIHKELNIKSNGKKVLVKYPDRLRKVS